jgi:hypothetical protein
MAADANLFDDCFWLNLAPAMAALIGNLLSSSAMNYSTVFANCPASIRKAGRNNLPAFVV